MRGRRTHHIPCSLLFCVSRMGFSNMHSIPAWRQRLQGGLSASVHFIFCLRQAFCQKKKEQSRAGEMSCNLDRPPR